MKKSRQLPPAMNTEKFEQISQKAVQDNVQVANKLKIYGYQWNSMK